MSRSAICPLYSQQRGDVMGPSGDRQIVWTWVNDFAPTGESEFYETSDGRVWQQCRSPGQHTTGMQYGTIRGDRIEES